MSERYGKIAWLWASTAALVYLPSALVRRAQSLTSKELRIGLTRGGLACVGVLAGLALWWRVSSSSAPTASAEQAKAVIARSVQAEEKKAGAEIVGNPVALRYATAFQQDAWDEIVDTTCWMQQRLTRVQIETGSTDARDEARVRLLERVSSRSVEGNQLRLEGIEDQYVFVRGAELAVVALDAGNQGLEQATKDRTWIRVTYPSRREALRDAKGIPIRSITIGVNVSPDGLVLKANIIGNLDVEWTSISYDWESRASLPTA